MKTLDVILGILLIVGGLNWGLVGLFNIDVVAFLFGPMSVVTRLVYTLVGISAIYEALELRSIHERWTTTEAHGVA